MLHTKGEWKAERSSDNARWQVVGNDHVLVQHTFDGPEAEANARLIASAPVLLDALKEAYEELKFFNSHNSTTAYKIWETIKSATE